MKRRLIKVLLPITALLLSSCSFSDFFKPKSSDEPAQKEEQKEEEQKVYLDNPINIGIDESLPLTIGQSKSLSVTYSPEDTVNKEVQWTSSNTSIATVLNGKVTGVAPGKTKVSVSAKNRLGETITSECNVVVADPTSLSKTTLKYTYDDYNANSCYALDNTPLKGNPKLLVVPIWFSDSDTFISMSYREMVRDDIRKAFFGTNEETGWRSLKTFFEEESQNTITISGTVADWYETGESYEAYGSESAGANKTAYLVNTAATYYFEHSSESRTDYDTNDDGYLDGVLLIYAAPDYDNLDSNSLGNLWAYTSWLQTYPSVGNPTANVFFWGSYDFMYSAGVDAYARTEISMFGRGDTRHCKIDPHCYIHEMGHVFGLPDYYDYSGIHSPAAGFSMQDMNVGGHDPYSLLAFGWAQPYIPTETSTIIINDFQSSHDVILLVNHEVDSPFDEYLLLEFYSPTGLNKFDSDYHYNDRYPRGPKNVGIRLWHVDARLTYWTGYTFTKMLITDPTHGNVYHATSNTTPTEWNKNSFAVEDYADFNTLQLIRREGQSPYLTKSALFNYGSSFSIDNFSDQFVNGAKMNSNKKLNWTFTVDAMDETSAAITVTKS